ncbi:MAG: heparinase II/III family protein [Candidatus Sumerlaeia bacterium]
MGADDFLELFKERPLEHPSIYIRQPIQERIDKLAQSDPVYGDAWEHLLVMADVIVEAPALEREMRGRRMLFTSRRCLKRVTYCAMAYRVTGEKKYAQAARRDMLAAAAFKNWNPSHFLDVGEMTTALAIGYDWLYDFLSEEERDAIRKAIIHKGLKTVRDHMWWLEADNNWNQVCNGGLAIGALVVRDYEPELAAQTLERSLRLIPTAMEEYEPDGAFPEGPGYWKYGTSYNLLFLEALQTSLGTDAGLLERFPAFVKSGFYARHALGPSGITFCYSDCSRDIEDEPNTPLFWFARELKQPTLLDYDKDILPFFFQDTHDPASRKERFLAFMFLWAPLESTGRSPLPLSWQGDGPMPVAFHRTSWDDAQATYVGIKGGRPIENHGHMDVGTFVIDAKGMRWAEDLGKESYGAMEKHGLKIWDRGQNSERWSVYRHSNKGHNCLVVNGQRQIVDSHSPIVRSQMEGPRRFTIIDMSPAYAGQLASARRGIMLHSDGQVVIQDEVAAEQDADIRWGMLTRAKVEIVNPKLAKLEQGGEIMYLHLEGVEGAGWQMFSTRPHYEFNRSNENTSMIGFMIQSKKGEGLTWRVTFQANEKLGQAAIQPLGKW